MNSHLLKEEMMMEEAIASAELAGAKIPKPKIKCRGCGKTRGVIKFYIIADDLENPKPYHPACIRNLMLEVIMKLSDTKAQISSD